MILYYRKGAYIAHALYVISVYVIITLFRGGIPQQLRILMFIRSLCISVYAYVYSERYNLYARNILDVRIMYVTSRVLLRIVGPRNRHFCIWKVAP